VQTNLFAEIRSALFLLTGEYFVGKSFLLNQHGNYCYSNSF